MKKTPAKIKLIYIFAVQNLKVMDAIWYGIAALFELIFDILPLLANIPNLIFIVVIFLLVCYWVYYSVKVEKHEENNYLSR